MPNPRRLIEYDIPIGKISEQARREKSVRRGNIATLHTWWARRPLSACRAIALAALLPDPADTSSGDFPVKAFEALSRFRDAVGGPPVGAAPEQVREAALSFIERFSAVDASMDPSYLECARRLVNAAYPDAPPLVVDPFAGGGAIPLEALRVGADAWAADYNPVAALLLKVLLEDIPRFGERLADGVQKWGAWIGKQVASEIAHLYPPDPDGAIPIAYLWARTVSCEGPGCGAEIPLLRQLWLARKGKRSVALRLVVDAGENTIDFEIEMNPSSVAGGTVKRGAAICPICNAVTPVARVRAQAKTKGGLPVRMIAVVRTYPGRQGRDYRLATDADRRVAQKAAEELSLMEDGHRGPLSLVPNEPLPPIGTLGFRVQQYGMKNWGQLYLSRQALTMVRFSQTVSALPEMLEEEGLDRACAKAVATSLAICVDRQAEASTTLCRWNPVGEKVQTTFGRQALPMVWDFAEVNCFGGSVGDWDSLLDNWESAFTAARWVPRPGSVAMGDARHIHLPDSSVDFVFTDPPYYDAVPYADLSDFFYVWLRRSVGSLYPDFFSSAVSPKAEEIVADRTKVDSRGRTKDGAFFEEEMRTALIEARRVLKPDGIAVLVFAHKTTLGWESMLAALINAGWTVTGSWPLDTEMLTRLRAMASAALASSIHIVCRPRSPKAGVGDWRTVREELEKKVAEWLPRLAQERVEGADAIFACLGPAMEVFSRFQRVETAAGEEVPLSPPQDQPNGAAFLPAVWAAIGREALRVIFEGPEAEVFEEDARLTALWLWTLKSAVPSNGSSAQEPPNDDEIVGEAEGRVKNSAGLALDYDTARKLAQALGAHLDDLARPGGVIEVKGATSRLISVSERRQALLGEAAAKREEPGTLFEATSGTGSTISVTPGSTTLDRIHQAMLLFADGRGEALRLHLSEVADERLRSLARALSALYPATSSEKRWVDGVWAAMR